MTKKETISSFEEILPIAKRIAGWYVRKSRRHGHHYDVDELVNEVCATGYWKTTDKKFLNHRIHDDIKSYMRKQNGCRSNVSKETRNAKFSVRRPFSMSEFVRNGSDGKDFNVLDDTLIAKDEINWIEDNDSFNFTLSRLQGKAKLMIKLRYIEDFTLKEIGKVIGCSESRICQLMGDTHNLIKERLELEDMESSNSIETCPVCGGWIVGDGETSVRRCELVDIMLEEYSNCEPSGPTIYCTSIKGTEK